MVYMRDIVGAISLLTGLSREDIMGTCRKRKFARARQLSVYFCRKLTANSYPSIGYFFQQDHSTSLHACRGMAKLAAADPVLWSKIEHDVLAALDIVIARREAVAMKYDGVRLVTRIDNTQQASI